MANWDLGELFSIPNLPVAVTYYTDLLNALVITLQKYRYVIKADRINRFKLHGTVTDSTDCYICTRSFLTGFTKFLR